jgi:hypothetical protein
MEKGKKAAIFTVIITVILMIALLVFGAVCLLKLTDKTDSSTTAEVVTETVSTETTEKVATEVAVDTSDNTSITERPYHEAVPDIEVGQLLKNPSTPIENSTLPRIDINFVDGDEYTISKKVKAEANISISNVDESYQITDALATVNVRGNSTAEPAKKPLKIKFEESQNVLGISKNKKWTLLANIYDKTAGLHNYVAYNLYSYVTENKGFESACVFVDVYVNGGYQGVYTLCDQVEADKDRINISEELGDTPETTDYLIEQDYRVYYDDPDNGTEGIDWFWMTDLNECFEIKYPNSSDTESTEYATYIRDYIDTVYNALNDKDWDLVQELIDVQSFIDGYMVAELVKSTDISQSSVYFYKKAGGKLTFATLWDCDLTFGCGDRGEATADLVSEESFLFGRLIQIPEFRELYKQQYIDNYEDYKQYMLDTLDNCMSTYKESLENDYNAWESRYNWCDEQLTNLSSYDEQIEYMRDWIEARADWLLEQYLVY